MKVIINKNKEDIKVPFLMQYSGSNYIILVFCKSNELFSGTVIASDTPQYPIGYHSNTWTTENWVLFRGSITLEN